MKRQKVGAKRKYQNYYLHYHCHSENMTWTYSVSIKNMK